MKKLKSVVALLLGLSTFFTVSCGVKEETYEIDMGLRETFVGTHIFTATDTQDDLVKNGRTQYAIVKPENATKLEETAVEEFVELFRTATDIKLSVVTDAGLTHSGTNTYISIGKTSIAKAVTQMETERAELGLDGCRVVTKDKTIFIYGGGDTGTLYGVYDFMSVTFGFEQYYLDCMEMQTGLKNVKLKNYDIKNIPDFAHRGGNNTTLLNESQEYTENAYANRLRIKGSRGVDMMPIHKEFNTYAGGRGSTNSLTYLPMDIYNDIEKPETYHPLWYSDNGNELCFTAHGDEAEFELMLEECAKKVENSLTLYTPEEYPQYQAVTLTQQDNLEYCTCETCADLTELYGDAIVGVYIVFMNKLAERVNAWMELPENAAYKRENFKYLFFAYSYTVSAPAKYNPETKSYEPFHPDIKMHEDVGAYLAMTDFDYQLDFWSDANKLARENVIKWADLTDTIYYWMYITNFRNFMWMYESFSFSYDGAFAWLANRSTTMVFSQSQEPTKGTMTAWHNLKQYLEAKLGWDTSLNTGELIENYFDAMYGPASDSMLNLFYDMRTYMNKIIVEENEAHGKGDARPSLEKKENWPLAVLEKWLAEIDDAKAQVGYLATVDPKQHEKLCQHMEAEAISVIYILLNCHLSTMTETQKAEYVNRLRYDIEWMGLQEMTIGHSAGSYLSIWLDGVK
jgi:hypothetical protein